MKLKELYISDYKGFKNFSINFDLNSTVTTIIGKNGVGKSNLIEIIVSIFRSIDLGEQSEFSYKLIYECQKHDIELNVDHNNPQKNQIIVDGQRKSLTYLKTHSVELLPLNIFTYYSGTNWRLEELFVKHQTQFYKKLTDGDDQILRRFFYCRDVHSFFVLLAFLVGDDPTSKSILDKFGISSLDSVLFCLKKPYWYKGKPNKKMKEEGDPRFWFSRGVVKDFLGNLWKYAIAPIDNKERKTVDFRGRTETQDRLYLFLPDQKSLKSLAENYADTSSLFKNIESTYIADLLERVDVTVTLKNGQNLTFDQLSEGERQLLTVIGLIKFTRDDESLFLLDEPDTHLNPRWKLNYFKQIEKILNHKIEGSDRTAWDSSQVILTTHDPLMLTSLYAEQVRVIDKDKEGVVTSETPDYDPINLGVEAIIQSDLYGIRTSLDKEIQEMIDLRNYLLSKKELKGQLLAEFNRLNKDLDKIGLSNLHPNPYFSNFAKAISRNPKFRKPDFTKEEYREIQKLSDELLSEIIEEEKENDKD